jgi:hypothetical protein
MDNPDVGNIGQSRQTKQKTQHGKYKDEQHGLHNIYIYIKMNNTDSTIYIYIYKDEQHGLHNIYIYI